MKRAMTDSAKVERSEQILSAAIRLFEHTNYEKLKMIDIAKEANVSKGTLFNYFSSKETLFMEILFKEYAKRWEKLIELLNQYDQMDYPEFKQFVLDEMALYLDMDSIYMRLSVIKNVILEKNIEHDTVVRDKVDMYENMKHISQLIIDRVDFLTTGTCMDIFMAQHAIIVGYMNFASMPKGIIDGMAENQLEGFKVDFRNNAMDAMGYYLDGVYVKQKCIEL